MPDVISGQVPIGVVSATAAMAQARAGKLKAVAIMSQVKLLGADDLQSLATALPGFDAAPRLFLLAPAGLPQPVADRLGEAARIVMAARTGRLPRPRRARCQRICRALRGAAAWSRNRRAGPG